MIRFSKIIPRSGLIRQYNRNVTCLVYKNRFSQLRLYSNSKDEKPKKQESILTDDMLAKAGFEDAANEGEAKNSEDKKSQPDDGEPGTQGSRKRRRAKTSKDIQREKYANWAYISSFVGGVLGLGFMARNWDSEQERKDAGGEGIDDGYTPGLMYQRLSKRMGSLFSFFAEPAFEQLLPPPAPEAYRRPLTLVVTLDDFLIHSDWDMKNGWRTGKRPGLDYFLGYLSQYYEIVIFGSNYQYVSDRVIQKLDPYHAYISYALYREACRYKDGKLIKDLSLLNRDLSKTVLIDVSEDSWALQPENALPMKPWDGKPDDTLVRLIPFLEYLATQPIKDVRPILNSFRDKSNIIEEFTEREKKLREQWRKDNQHLFDLANRPNAANFLASLLGVSQGALNKEPKMPLDIIREHGQMQYEHFQRYLQENAPKIKEEEQKLKEEFGKFTLNKLVTEGVPSPETIAKMQAEKSAENAEGTK